MDIKQIYIKYLKQQNLIFKNWRLGFIQDDIEYKYSEIQLLSLEQGIKFLTVILTISGFIVASVNFIKTEYETSIMGMAFSILMLTGLLLHQQNVIKQSLEYIYYIILLSSFIVSFEQIYQQHLKNSDENWKTVEVCYIVQHLLIIFFLITTLLNFLTSWMQKIIFLLPFVSYLIIRFTYRIGTDTISFLIIILIVFWLVYLREKIDKTQFFLIFKYNESISKIQKILDEAFPDSIIIINQLSNINGGKGNLDKLNNNQFKILFTNKQFFKEFNSKEDYIINQIFHQMKVTTQYNNTDNHLINDNQNDLFSQLNTDVFKDIKFFQAILQTQEKNQFHLNNEANGIKNFQISVSEIIWNESPSYMLIFKNISQDIVAARMQNINLYKDHILSTVTHNLKTPLNCIMLSLETVISQFNILKSQEIIKYISDSAKSGLILLTMINEMIDYSRNLKGSLRLSFTNFNVRELIEKVREINQVQFKRSDVRFEIMTVGFESPETLLVHNDKERLFQVLMNLVGNALQYTFQGSVCIRAQKTFKEIIKFNVIDTGIGMSEDKKMKLVNKIFSQKFQKEIDHTTGAGLGLTICQMLVEQLGPSSLQFKSIENEGTNFSFDLYSKMQDQTRNSLISDIRNEGPFTPSISGNFDEARIDQGKQSNFNNILDFSLERKRNYQISQEDLELIENQKLHEFFSDQQRVLIVDDTIFNIIALKTLLSSFQLTIIDEAFNGIQALQLIENKFIDNNLKFPYDIIFMDINMPLMDGFTAIQQIKEKYNFNFLVVIVSAFTDYQDKRRSQQCGADFHISKPVSNSVLMENLIPFKLGDYYNSEVEIID